MIEETMFFLKPEAILYADQIVALIEATGLYVEIRGNRTISKMELKELYPDLLPELQDATDRHLLDVVVPVFSVSGESAVDRLVDIAGRKVDPKKCGKRTIRHNYGSKKPVALGAGLFYYRNGIHRPQNWAEAARDIALFFS